LGEAVRVELPAVERGRAREHRLDEGPQLVLVLGGEDEAALATRAGPGPELPHDAVVDPAEVLAHPAREVPALPPVGEVVEALGRGGERRPPGVDPAQELRAA